MLRLIVEAAIHWMQIGLPMKELKIVLYQNKTESINQTNQILLDYFESLKHQNLEATIQRVKIALISCQYFQLISNLNQSLKSNFEIIS